MPLIIESIVTTLDHEGRANFAPMGVEWGEEAIVLKPFLETTTFRNVRATGVARRRSSANHRSTASGATACPYDAAAAGSRRAASAHADAAGRARHATDAV